MDPESIRLLLISDDEADAAIVRRRLEEIPHTSVEWTRSVESGTSALEYRRHDLCLLDYDLGARSGFELLEQHGDQIPTIVLVRQTAAKFSPRALPAGAFDVLDRAHLLEPIFERTIRHALQRRSSVVAMQQTEARFRALIEATPEAIVVHDRGRILYVNARTLRDYGCQQPDQLIGSSLLDLFDPDDRSTLKTRLSGSHERCARTSEPPTVCRLVFSDGITVSTEVSEVPVTWDGAPATALLARDMNQGLDMQARLLVADRFARGSALAASVAHEINNPLAYVSSNLVFAIDELARVASSPNREPDYAARMEQVREALADARQGAERIEFIARDLQIFSQAGDDRKTSVDVHRVLQLAFNMTKSEIRGRARLVTDFEQVPEVLANDGRLAHVFINLLLNAAQAIPEGKARDHSVRVTTRAQRERVVVEISDTGLGMSSKVRERMFDPFFTTKPTVRTGIGLFVCHQIIQSMGGRIMVESELGRGSTVRVELPAKASGTVPATRQHEGRAHILIVDDEPLVCSSLQRSLKRDYEVTALQSARAALDLISAGEPFDIILCDLMMPDMSGMDLYEELDRHFPAYCNKFVFFTGGASTAGAREFLERVPNPRLEKPADVARIRELVRERIAS